MLRRVAAIIAVVSVGFTGCADENQRPTLGEQAPAAESTSSTQPRFDDVGDGDTTIVGDSSSTFVPGSGGRAGTTVSG